MMVYAFQRNEQEASTSQKNSQKTKKKNCGKGHHFVAEAGKIKVIINISMDNSRLCIRLKK